MKKIIDVDELAVGMYVTRVIKAKGEVKVKSEGMLKCDTGIAKLKQLKVLKVEIDTRKSELKEEEPEEIAQPETNLDGDIDQQATPLSQELKRAQSLYARSHQIQRNTFDKLRTTGKVDISQYEDMAKEFFDSIMRNQDALLCMTKLQDKDHYLLEHSMNVGILLAIFANHIGLSKEIGLKLTLAGLLHDIGKVLIPDEILLKEGGLTKEEFEHIKKHTLYGANILKKTGMEGLTVQIALQHHERLSGSGYPQGLTAHQLNQYVRMSAIVDVYDAITAERVYKEEMTPLQALKILKKNADVEFDGQLLNQFIAAVGLFPIGTLVLMKSEKLALVTKSNYEDPLRPCVTLFYHAKFKRHIEAKTLDLTSKRANDAINKSVNARDFGIDLNQIIKRFLLDD
ncbi:MAG: HD-GYP domain-containing protein [Aestuariibacter sp.]